MKIRDGFVSNSSSTSFIIRNEDVSNEQAYFIMHHYITEGDTKWHMRQEIGFMVGQTTAHSYDMKLFLEKIGVADDKVLWVNA